MGIEPTRPAWKAGTLPLSYTRDQRFNLFRCRDLRLYYYFPAAIVQVEEEGFEPSKAEPPDLQSGPFGRLGIPPFVVVVWFAFLPSSAHGNPQPVKSLGSKGCGLLR